MVINGNSTKFDLFLDIKRVSKLHTTYLSARVLELYNTYANLQFFARTEIVGFVPKFKIQENCRLHNKIFMDNDFCGQRATTIYCGPAYKFQNERYVFISQ